MTPLELDLAAPDVLVHRPVAHEAVQRALEAGGLVLLEHEVADPGEAVTAQQRVQQVLRAAAGQQHHQAQQRQRRADEVQPPAGAVAVLAQVERVELGERRERLRIDTAGGTHRASWLNAPLIAFNTPSGASAIRLCPTGNVTTRGFSAVTIGATACGSVI